MASKTPIVTLSEYGYTSDGYGAAQFGFDSVAQKNFAAAHFHGREELPVGQHLVALRCAADTHVLLHDVVERRDLLRLMMTEEPRMPEARNRLREEWRDRGVRFFNSLIEEGVQSGAFRAVDARLATFALLGSIRSVMLFYGVQRPVDQIGDELGEMVVRGLSHDAAANHRKVARA